MAEIKIEKKKPAWPWVLVALIVIGVVGYFIFANNDGRQNNDSAYDRGSDINKPANVGTDNARAERDNTRVLNQQNGQTATGNDQAVAEYVEFVRSDLKSKDLKSINHEKLREAFVHLTEATEAKAAEVGYTSSRLNIAREHADQLVADRSDTTHTQNIRATADILSEELVNIQQQKFPDLNMEASKLKDASASIKPEETVADQRQEIRSFLTDAADLLEEMDGSEGNDLK